MFADGTALAKKKPRVLISDGAQNFHVAWKNGYKENNENAFHLRHIHIKGDNNNNKMERFNGEIREREKVVRGLKKTNTVVIPSYQLYHNYFRPHEGLDGKTPAEAANIRIEGANKWITVIQNAANKQQSVKV